MLRVLISKQLNLFNASLNLWISVKHCNFDGLYHRKKLVKAHIRRTDKKASSYMLGKIYKFIIPRILTDDIVVYLISN